MIAEDAYSCDKDCGFAVVARLQTWQVRRGHWMTRKLSSGCAGAWRCASCCSRACDFKCRRPPRARPHAGSGLCGLLQPIKPVSLAVAEWTPAHPPDPYAGLLWQQGHDNIEWPANREGPLSVGVHSRWTRRPLMWKKPQKNKKKNKSKKEAQIILTINW
jgi:hypothetical protein